MAELRAFDPGDVYTGVAYFRTPDGVRDPEKRNPEAIKYGWFCYDAKVVPPEVAEDELARDLLTGRVLYVVWERFRLYPDKAQEQSSSEFRTAQSIGAYRFITRQVNDRRLELGYREIDVQVYGAEAKRPAREILRKKGIKSTARRLKAGPGEHAVDAELHGWHRIFDGLAHPQPGE